jgi:hypothetical protein
MKRLEFDSSLLSDGLKIHNGSSYSPISSPNAKASTCNIDINDPSMLKRLLDCLLYALAIDNSTNLADTLGMPASLSNHEALSLWVTQEIQGIQFLDASALFNYLFKQLDNLVAQTRREG